MGEHRKHHQVYRPDYLSKYVPSNKEKMIADISLDNIFTIKNNVPLYDLKVAAGNFSEIQDVSFIERVEAPSKYKPTDNYFACTVIGESMNKVIPNGSLCLFRKYQGQSVEGLIVLVEHSDIQDIDNGASYTIKEYQGSRFSRADGEDDSIITLKPLSSNKKYKNIVLKETVDVRLVIVGIFECIL